MKHLSLKLKFANVQSLLLRSNFSPPHPSSLPFLCIPMKPSPLITPMCPFLGSAHPGPCCCHGYSQENLDLASVNDSHQATTEEHTPYIHHTATLPGTMRNKASKIYFGILKHVHLTTILPWYPSCRYKKYAQN